MKKLLFALFIVSLVAIVACEGIPQAGDSPLATPDVEMPGEPPAAGEVPSLRTVFALVAAGSVGGIISFVFERFKWFQKLTGDARWWTIFGFSVGLPLLAQVALQYVPVEAWEFLEPYWVAVALGFLAFISSQGAHLVEKRLQASRSIGGGRR
jgi:MFS family permease